MPCYEPEPSGRQKKSVVILSLLDEVGLLDKPLNGHDLIFGQAHKLDEHTARLCAFCWNHDVTKYSLELQIWWRDHQEIDRQRLILEQAEKDKNKTEKNKELEEN